MTDDARANLYLAIGVGSLAAITADVFLWPQWWILVPLFIILVINIAWGISEQ